MNNSTLPTKKILLFWYPLLLTWLMMAIEGPFIAAIIARLPDEKMQLAAFGVSFSFALVIEAPVIMLMSATIALAKKRGSFLSLRRFTHGMNATVVLINLIILIPPIFEGITMGLIGLNQELSDHVYLTTALLIPWSPAIGYRRFYQGLLIKYHQTRKVTFGTIFRLATMALTSTLLAKYSHLPGSAIGGAALSCGVLAEAFATRLLARVPRADILSLDDEDDSINMATIWAFYYPLALTSLIGLSVRPAMVFFLGQSKMAIETLAVLPVINALLFIFSAIGLSFQEVGVALMGEGLKYRKKLHRFTCQIASIVCLLYGLIVLTPLSGFWFETVSGLSDELSRFSNLPAQLLLVMPWLSVYLSFQRALMVNLKTTRFVSHASAIEVLGILISLTICVFGLDLIGAIGASIAMVIGRVAAVTYLRMRS